MYIFIKLNTIFCSEIRQEMCVYTHKRRCTHKRTTKNTQKTPRKAATTYTNGWVTCVYTAKHAWRRDRGIHIERGAYTKSMNPGDHTQKARFIHDSIEIACALPARYRTCIYTWTGVFRRVYIVYKLARGFWPLALGVFCF